MQVVTRISSRLDRTACRRADTQARKDKWTDTHTRQNLYILTTRAVNKPSPLARFILDEVGSRLRISRICSCWSPTFSPSASVSARPASIVPNSMLMTSFIDVALPTSPDSHTGHVTVVVEQGLSSHQTHYRSYRGGLLWVKRSNKQCQSTEGREVLRTRLQFH